MVAKRKVSNSRPARWERAANDARMALDRVLEAATDLQGALDDLSSIKDEYQDWYDNMPDGVRYSATGELLEALTNLDFDVQVEDALQDVITVIDEAEGAQLPLGFGRH